VLASQDHVASRTHDRGSSLKFWLTFFYPRAIVNPAYPLATPPKTIRKEVASFLPRNCLLFLHVLFQQAVTREPTI
jgi:hypothetical protein